MRANTQSLDPLALKQREAEGFRNNHHFRQSCQPKVPHVGVRESGLLPICLPAGHPTSERKCLAQSSIASSRGIERNIASRLRIKGIRYAQISSMFHLLVVRWLWLQKLGVREKPQGNK